MKIQLWYVVVFDGQYLYTRNLDVIDMALENYVSFVFLPLILSTEYSHLMLVYGGHSGCYN
jgi:hypothetical protein